MILASIALYGLWRRWPLTIILTIIGCVISLFVLTAYSNMQLSPLHFMP
jgi:uncharacterized membrane protein (UPF0136 family)